MTRNLFLFIISVLLTLTLNPVTLTATDEVAVTGLDSDGIVETVPLPEPVVEVAVEAAPETVVSYAAAPSLVAAQPSTVQVLPADAISVAGHVIPVVEVGDTGMDAGNHVNKYGAKFLYGHNSPAVFGDLIYLGVGNVFMVSSGGVTSTYQVAEVQFFEKVSETMLSSNGSNYKMSAVVNGKGRYDMVLMTCYGTMYGNGDASHRLVVFANRV